MKARRQALGIVSMLLLLVAAPAWAQTGRLTVASAIEGLTVAPTTVNFPITAVGTTSAPKTIIVNSVSGGQRVGSLVVAGPFRIVTNHVQTNLDAPTWSGLFGIQSSGDIVVVFEPTTATAAVGTLTIHPMPAPSPTFAVDDLVRVKEPTGATVRVAGSPFGTVIGTQVVGAFGKISGPPVSVDNGEVWWWPVTYLSGPSGYSWEGDLAPVPRCRWTLTYTPAGPGASPRIRDEDTAAGGYDLTVDVIEGSSVRRVGAMTVLCP